MAEFSRVRLKDMVRCYGKAKADLFYSNDDRALDLVKYEANLKCHLRSLAHRINQVLTAGPDTAGALDQLLTPKFIGSGAIMPKTLSSATVAPGTSRIKHDNSLFSAPRRHWDLDLSQTKLTAEFRVLSKCSIDFHVFATLWTEVIGDRLDAALDVAIPENNDESEPSTSAYGNRIRRTRSRKYNKSAPGTLQPYLFQYQRWQNTGYRAMELALSRGEKIAVVTSDIRSFFGSLDPSFLIHDDFLSGVTEPKLNDAEGALHHAFVSALLRWRASVAETLHISEEHIGLPIGLAASGVVANAALIELDKFVRDQLNPLHYGRYVDDVTLVLHQNDQLNSSEKVLRWITERSRLRDSDAGTPLLEPSRDNQGLRFIRSYLTQSDIVFASQKTKFTFLEGQSGKFVLDSLRASDQERASEWRELPELPSRAEFVGRDMTSIVDNDGNLAESLRSAASVRSRRATFALALRDVEAYAKDLDPESWKDHRQAFIRTVCTFILQPHTLMNLERYLPRILLVALACRDWDALVKLIEATARCYVQIRDAVASSTAQLRISLNSEELEQGNAQEILARWGARLREVIETTILRDLRDGIPVRASEDLAHALASLPAPSRKVLSVSDASGKSAGARRLRKPKKTQTIYLRLFAADLAASPFRAALLPRQWSDWAPQPGKHLLSAKRLPAAIHKRKAIKQRYRITRDLLGSRKDRFSCASTGKDSKNCLRFFSGVAFPTRPTSLTDYYAASRVLTPQRTTTTERAWPEFDPETIREGLNALRGYGVKLGQLPTATPRGKKSPYPAVRVSATQKNSVLPPSGKVRIALGMVETTREQLARAIHDSPALSRERYASLIRLINDVIRDHREIDYLVLPELAVPARWYLRIAQKLQRAGVSLIAGVEYQVDEDSPKRVSNQVWASLCHTDWGFPSNVIYVQDKQRAAPGEEINLLRENGASLVPQRRWDPIPIIEHRGFRFSLLICSELTNIATRAAARGNVDAIITPQWNRDVETFGAIVESAAYDVHCFIVQANNRTQGDTRIRAPYKDHWKRDVVKVSGGTQDQIIVGHLDVAALRAFQSSHLKSTEEFKPLPDGFEMDPDRSIYSLRHDGV